MTIQIYHKVEAQPLNQQESLFQLIILNHKFTALGLEV